MSKRKLEDIRPVAVNCPESASKLREDILIKCGCIKSASVSRLCSSREIDSTSFGNGVRTACVNSFLPTDYKVVHSNHTKSFCCQFLKDGQELAVASQDEIIRFFRKNTSDGQNADDYTLFKEIPVQECNWSILDVAFNKEGSFLCYGTWSNCVHMLKISDGQPEQWNRLQIKDTYDQMAVFSIRFSSEGKEIVCGGSDNSLHVFDLERQVKVLDIEDAHEDEVNAVCYSDEDSHLIFSSGDDGLIKVWDRRAWSEGDKHPVGVFAGHQSGVTYVDSRGDGRYILSNCKDQTIKVWDLRKFSSNIDIWEHREKFTRWDYRTNGVLRRFFRENSNDNSVITLRGHVVRRTLIRAKFSPERTGKRYIYTGCGDGNIFVYDLLNGNVEAEMHGHRGVVRDVDWNPQDNEIVSCSWDGNTNVWQYKESMSITDSCLPKKRKK